MILAISSVARVETRSLPLPVLTPFPSKAIGLSVGPALEDVGKLRSGQLFSRIPKPGLFVTVCRPSQTLLVAPGKTKRRFLATAHQVRCFVQQYGGALVVINRNSENPWKYRTTFKRKIVAAESAAGPN